MTHLSPMYIYFNLKFGIKCQKFKLIKKFNNNKLLLARVYTVKLTTGLITGGMRKETQLMVTNMAEGRYTLRTNGPRDLVNRISNPYTL